MAADVGGTKTAIGLLSGPPWSLDATRARRLENAGYRDFDDLLGHVVRDSQARPDVVCIAAAGPVMDGRVSMTNLSWNLDAERIADVTGARAVRLLNDLEATALGCLAVPDEARQTIQAGDPPSDGRHVVTIAPGTGLGEAILCWDGEHHHPVASEGGHVDFAPLGKLQSRLLEWLAARHGHVSYERVLSGPGLASLYEFLRETGAAPESDRVRAAITAGDAPAVISREALHGDDALCRATLDVFVRVLGAKAGNLALQALAFGGVFVAGGITAHIAPALADGRFQSAFLDKGRHRHVLERMPVTLILDPDTAWLGAASFAARLAHSAM